MEEVLEQFKTTAIDSQNITCFDGMYKNWGKLGQQGQRRKEILDDQRRSRNTNLDMFRGILEVVKDIDKQDLFPYQKKQTQYKPSIYVAGFTKPSATYRDVLMMSEWLVEKPVDFENSWYVVPCPKGVRTLVVAYQGDTKCYTKHGVFRMACRTALPGGNPSEANYKNRVVLDCFHVEATNTLYVLDLLFWNNHPMTDGETEFRHYWLKTHIEDIPALKTVNSINKIKFEVLPKVYCDRVSLNKFMSTCPHFKDFTPCLDGLLFYHKGAFYVSGQTPLVGWLYPFMVNEVLGSEIQVNPAYMLQKPGNYVNQAQYIQEFEKKMAKRGPKFEYAVEEKKPNKTKDKERQHETTKQRSNDAEMTESSEIYEANLEAGPTYLFNMTD